MEASGQVDREESGPLASRFLIAQHDLLKTTEIICWLVTVLPGGDGLQVLFLFEQVSLMFGVNSLFGVQEF